MRVGDYAPADAPKGSPVEPPAKRCRHCGAESRTHADRCPNCGRRYGSGPWVVVAAIAASLVTIVLLLGGCAALIAIGLDAAKDEIDERAITRAEFDAVKPGDSEAAVRAQLGKPLSEDSLRKRNLTCLQYAEKGEGVFGLDEFELCFRDGVLVRKSAG